MTSTVSVRISAMSTRRAGGQRRHDLRDPAHIPAYVDKDKLGDNSVLLAAPEPADLRSEIAANRVFAGQQKLRDDARIAYSGIITWGTDAQRVIAAMPTAEQDQLYQDVALKIAERADRDLLGLVVHRDEASPHAHFTLRGYKLDDAGKEQPLRLSKSDTADLQTVAGQVMAEHKLEITRGKPKAQRIEDGEDRSKIIHRSVVELHRDLPKELEAARQKLEKNRALADKAKQDLEAETQGREEKIQKRLEAYERRAAVAKSDAERLEALLPKDDTQPAPVVTVTTADVKDWQPRKAGWFREETETAAAERATQSPTIRAANRLLSDQHRALGFSENRTTRERSDRQAAERQRDELARKYEKGLSDQQRQRLQQLADQTRRDNELRREEERKKQQERSKDKDKDKGLER